MTPKPLPALIRFYPVLRILPWFLLGQGLFYLTGPSIGFTLTLCFLTIGLLGQRISFLFLGLGLFSLVLSSPPRLRAFETDVSKFGQVINEPRYPKAGEIKFEFQTQDKIIYACKGVELPWRNSSALVNGARLSIRGSFVPLDSNLNPFSFENSLSRRGISGQCVARFLEYPREIIPPAWSGLRRSMKNWLTSKLGDSETTGLIISMAIGIPSGVSEITENEFRVLGLLHVLVVSGFQVGVLYYFLNLGIRFLPVKVKFPVEIFVLGITALYVQICAGERAAMRALIALLLAILATKTSGRRTLFGGSLASLFVVSLIWPGSVYDLGTELTYGALFGIALGAEVVKARHSVISGAISALTASMMTSLLCIAWGKVMSPLGLLLNPIFPPILSWVSGPLLGTAALISFINQDAGDFLFWVVFVCIEWLTWCIKLLAPYGKDLESVWITVSQILVYLVVIIMSIKKTTRHWLQFRGLRGFAIRGEG